MYHSSHGWPWRTIMISMKLCGIVHHIHIYHHEKFRSDWMNRSSGIIKLRIILFLCTLGYFSCRNISGTSTSWLTMKTSIFFHETFRISYYHIYLSPPKIWEESEMFGNWTWLPVPPLLVGVSMWPLRCGTLCTNPPSNWFFLTRRQSWDVH